MIIGLLLIAYTPALSQHKQAAQTQSLSDTLKIDEVTVFGSRIRKEIIPVQMLQGSTLQKLSVHSVADAIRYFSGVQIKDYGGIGGLKTVNIRSLGSHHVGVFYDGVELGNAQNGVVDLGRFSLDNMEAISMYNGQKSAIFQPAKDYASASSIYMHSRTPQFSENKRNNLIVNLKGGSFETVNPSVLWDSRLSQKLSSSVSAEYMYTSGRYKFSYIKKNGYDTTEVRKNGDVQALRLETGLYKTMHNGEWKIKAYYYTSERGYPGASVREEPGRFKHQDRQWDNNFFTQGSFRKNFTPLYSLLLNGKYANDYLHYLSDPRQDISTMYVNNHYRQQELYFSAAHLFSIFHWWSASLANDFQRNTLNADLIDFVYPTRYSLLSSLATSIQLKRLKVQASALHSYYNDKTKTSKANAGEKNEITPSLIASWQPFCSSDFNIRAFYKRVFRMPTLNDLYYTFIGNKDLNPEYTNQYNLGFTYTKKSTSGFFQQLEVQADAYYNEVDDKIIAMPTSNQFRWTMLNLGHVEIRGLDAAIQIDGKTTRVGFNIKLSYTFQKAQDFTNPQSKWYGGQIPYIPWHSATLILGGQYKTWHWNYSFIYTGERYEAVANIPENYAQPWYTHDFSISKNIECKNANYRFTAEVNNIFNQQYEVVQCYPMPGTNLKIKLSIIL